MAAPDTAHIHIHTHITHVHTQHTHTPATHLTHTYYTHILHTHTNTCNTYYKHPPIHFKGKGFTFLPLQGYWGVFVICVARVCVRLCNMCVHCVCIMCNMSCMCVCGCTVFVYMCNMCVCLCICAVSLLFYLAAEASSFALPHPWGGHDKTWPLQKRP
jgi:hypothetical protein